MIGCGRDLAAVLETRSSTTSELTLIHGKNRGKAGRCHPLLYPMVPDCAGTRAGQSGAAESFVFLRNNLR